MAPQRSPAFSFYARDFLAGTSTMSLQEVGAYIRLLAYQWDSDGVPEEADERARLLGCSKAQEKELWKKVGRKFVLADGVYVNARLEQERQKQTDRRQRLSDNGAKGGRPKANANQQAKQSESNSFPVGKANGNLNESLAFASAFPEEQKLTQTARARSQGNGANAPGSLPRDHRFHAVCGPRFRVCFTEATAAQLAQKWGGEPNDAWQPLRDFAEWLEGVIGDGPKGDHLWLLKHFEAFMTERGRVPVAPKLSASNGVGAAIDAWGQE